MSGPPVKRQLTDKEIDILRWMRANGDSNRKIAEALGVSSRPVKRQIYMDIAAGIVQGRQPGNGRRIADDERSLLARLHSEGMSTPEKAKALGRSLHSTIYLLNLGLREGWIQKAPCYWPAADKALFLQLRNDGVPALEIAARMKRSIRSVQSQIRRHLQTGLVTSRYDDEKFAERAGVPVSALADYRFLRGKRIPAAEAVAMCRAARP